jgi:hypothetical protein
LAEDRENDSHSYFRTLRLAGEDDNLVALSSFYVAQMVAIEATREAFGEPTDTKPVICI